MPIYGSSEKLLRRMFETKAEEITGKAGND
jgi:hypothetical protein